MKKTLGLISVIVLYVGLCLGCAGQNLRGQDPNKVYTLEELVEMSRACVPDARGWGILAVPDKDFDNTSREFVFITRGDMWGVGIVFHSQQTSIVLINDKTTGTWYFDNGVEVGEVTPDTAKELLTSFWVLVEENGDFGKIRTFTLLNIAPKEGI